MRVIEKLRDIWTRYGGWFKSLSLTSWTSSYIAQRFSFSLVASSHVWSHFSWF